MPAAPDIAPGHIGLSVTDLDRSLAFYREVLELEVIQASAEAGRRFAFLGAGGRLFLTLWQQSSAGFEPRQAGLHHLAFQLPTFEAVQATEARVRARGGTPHYDGVVPHREGADSAALFFSDPDGIRLEVYSATGAAGLPAPVPGAPSCGFF
ncbi:MAG: VOC family protein [Gemmatimonadales bacterium]